MNVEKEHFDLWMFRLMDRIDKLEDTMSHVTKQQNCVENEQILDYEDLMFLLKASKRTLLRYHQKGLPHFYLNGKAYHKLSDVMNFIKNEETERIKWRR